MKKLFVISIFILKLFSCTSAWTPAYFKNAYYDFISLPLFKDTENPLYSYSFVSPWVYEDRKDYYEKIKKRLNLREWSEYLGVDEKDIERTLYEKKSFDFKKIKDRKKREEFISYLDALGMIDYDTDWRKVLKRFLALYKKSELDFFKLRDAYNIVRAYHHLKMFDKELEFIDSLNSLKNDEVKNSIVWEWIESFKAGAIRHKGDFVVSSYLFAKVFATHKSDAYVGYYDFKVRNDKEWRELLKLAKNREDVLLFHFLRALNPKNNALWELKKMSEIDSDSVWVDRLLFLVAQKVQYTIFLLKEDCEDCKDDKKRAFREYIESFLNYLQKNRDSDFREYLFAYLKYIYNDKRVPLKNKKYQKLLDYLAYVDALEVVDEDEISKRLKEIEALFENRNIKVDLERYTIRRLYELYPKDSVKKSLAKCFYDREEKYYCKLDFRKSLDLNKLNEFVNLKNKRRNYIENLLLSKKETDLGERLIRVYYSVLYTAEGDFKKALKYVKNLPVLKNYDDTYYWDKKDFMRGSFYNPFNVDFTANNRALPRSKLYTHERFLKTILKIKKKLKQDPNSVTDNFLMANAWYNISDFGNSPMFAKIYRCVVCVDPKALPKLQKAKEYYLKVLSLTSDRELRAKVYYQLMKIALGKKMIEKWKEEKYYIYGDFSPFKWVKDSDEYKDLYRELEKYKDTKYYKEIKDCAGFQYFK